MRSLDGLTTLDPSPGVRRNGRYVVITIDDRVIGRFPAPHVDDADGWATLTVEAVVAAGKASPAIAGAGREAVYEAAFDAALSSLVGFSRYAGPRQAREQRLRRSGYGGIGIRLRTSDGGVVITAVVPDAPGDKAGLRPGDLLLGVDGVPVSGLDAEELFARLEGSPICT